MNLEKVFRDFCDSLQKRTCVTSEDTIRYYWFAAMLQNDADYDLNNYSLEYPYLLKEDIFSKDQKGNIAKKELDFLYNNGEECYCIEIKFHRNPDPNSTYAHPDAAGSLFNDLIRLAVFQPGKAYERSNEKVVMLPKTTRRFLLYVTDDEMNQYFTDNSRSQQCYLDGYRQPLRDFYKLKEGDIWIPSFKEPIPETFKKSTLFSMADNLTLSKIPNIRLVCSCDDLNVDSNSIKGESKNRHCYVRLYEVVM
jgi:hypothetical protein